MIEVKNLVKKYGNKTAVDGLSFTIEPGRIYGLLGPNGAGKSTTMNIMTGYLGATEGEVVIDGHNILEEPELAKKSIGYLPEIPPLYNDMTVDEYLHFAAELKKIPKAEREEQVVKAENMARVDDVAGRLIRNLSKGYRQRVGLAYAILGFPDIIILDEPTVGLDPRQIIEIREVIRELAKDHTVILSSHILTEVSEVCDYVMIISHGKLVASDTIENLYDHLGSTGELSLTVRTDENIFTNLMADMENVSITSLETDGEFLRTILSFDGNDDTLERIFFKIADARIPIHNLSKVTKSLEDLFLELTDSQTINEEAFESEDTAASAEDEEADELDSNEIRDIDVTDRTAAGTQEETYKNSNTLEEPSENSDRQKATFENNSTQEGGEN